MSDRVSCVLYYYSTTTTTTTTTVFDVLPSLLPPMACIKPNPDAIFGKKLHPNMDPLFSGGGRPENDIRLWKLGKSSVSGL